MASAETSLSLCNSIFKKCYSDHAILLLQFFKKSQIHLTRHPNLYAAIMGAVTELIVLKQSLDPFFLPSL